MAIKVMIVDDSAVMREVMQQLLAPHKDIEVVGAAMDPLLALQKMKTVWPDVILLDVEMPRMDGITFLRQIKATMGLRDFLQGSAQEMLAAIRTAAKARVRGAAGPTLEKSTVDAVVSAPSAGLHNQRTSERIVVLGTSTGGTQALEQVLSQLPRSAPAIAIVQHMPEKFNRSFAERLDSLCAIEVREAQNGDRLLPGLALIAPGGKHIFINHTR